MSKYDDIKAALLARLGEIRQAGGYRTDAGERVRLNLEYKTESEEKPMLAVFFGEVADALDGETAPSLGEENHYLPAQIFGFIEDNESGSEGEKLRQDILQALKKDVYFGGLTEGFEGRITSKAQVSVDDESATGFLGDVEVKATIFYVTPYGEG